MRKVRKTVDLKIGRQATLFSDIDAEGCECLKPVAGIARMDFRRRIPLVSSEEMRGIKATRMTSAAASLVPICGRRTPGLQPGQGFEVASPTCMFQM